MTPEEIAETLHALCDLAAVETLARFRVPIAVDNKDKGAFDPVTEADREAERVIRDELQKRFPGHGIIGEELGDTNPDADYQWIIDPVDGTRAFISGVPVWGTLIGLYKDGKPLAGIMHQPFTGERYLSDGHSTFLFHRERQTALKCTANGDIAQAIVMTTAPELFSDEEAGRFAKVVDAARMVRYGTDCYAYAQVAAGNVALVIEAGLNPYDIAALIPIVENAGGLVTNWQGGSAAEGGRILAAANSNLHQAAMRLLND